MPWPRIKAKADLCLLPGNGIYWNYRSAARDAAHLLLFPSLLLEISGAEGDASHDQRAGGRKRNRIEWSRRQRNDSGFICARGLADVTTVTRGAKPFRKAFHPGRQLRIATRNAVPATHNIRSQLRELFHRDTSRFPIRIEWGARPGKALLSCHKACPGIHVHGGESVSGHQNPVRRTEERNVTGRMARCRQPF